MRPGRRRIGYGGGALLAFALFSNAALACVPARPPSCEARESADACQNRAEKWYAEQEAARAEYEKKTPEERTQIEQARLWDDHEIVFLGRIEKIKLKGKIYPQSVPKVRKQKATKGMRPPMQIPPPVFVPFGDSYDVFIRPIRVIKGPAAFTASWQNVGGMTSCGPGKDGSLGYSYPGDEIVIFANWASRVTDNSNVMTEFLSLYGVDLNELVEPSIKAALASEQIGK